MNSNAKRDAAAKEFFIERYNGNGSFKVLNAEPNVVNDTKITINGVTMPAYTYFHVIEKSARDAEVAELMAQLKTKDEAIEVAVKALEELSHDTDYAWGEREAQEALHSINTLLGREG